MALKKELFSQRYKYNVQEKIQFEHFEEGTRNRLWNLIQDHLRFYYKDSSPVVRGLLDEVFSIVMPVNYNIYHAITELENIRSRPIRWYEILDILDYISQCLKPMLQRSGWIYKRMIFSSTGRK